MTQKTKGREQNIVHSPALCHHTESQLLKKGYKTPLILFCDFPMKSKYAIYTLYSVQCFIVFDCTELSFCLR